MSLPKQVSSLHFALYYSMLYTSSLSLVSSRNKSFHSSHASDYTEYQSAAGIGSERGGVRGGGCSPRKDYICHQSLILSCLSRSSSAACIASRLSNATPRINQCHGNSSLIGHYVRVIVLNLHACVIALYLDAFLVCVIVLNLHAFVPKQWISDANARSSLQNALNHTCFAFSSWRFLEQRVLQFPLKVRSASDIAGLRHSVDTTEWHLTMSLCRLPFSLLARHPYLWLYLVGNNTHENFFVYAPFYARLGHVGLIRGPLEAVPQLIHEGFICSPRRDCTSPTNFTSLTTINP